MWKCGFRRLRDTAERGVNHYDKCNSAYTPCSAFFNQCEKKNFPSCWFFARKCWNRFKHENDTKDKRWGFEHLNRTWIGAIAWSSALVFGWYTSQIIHLKFKSQHDNSNRFCVVPKVHDLFISLPFGNDSQKDVNKFDISQELGKFSYQSVPVVRLISNDPSDATTENNNKSWKSGSSGSSENELGEVLNSIENRLGLASIENGQHKEGINLLRSAANRNHAPAIYNLGLCYEMGLGVGADEKMAMELYRTAALLHHPKALYNLGIYYGQGRGGLSRDTVTATRLLRLAAIQGQEEAISALKALNIELSDSSSDDLVDLSPPSNKLGPVPTHSALFIENLQHSNFNYEPIVF